MDGIAYAHYNICIGFSTLMPFYKKLILILKTHQFINAVNGVSLSHKTLNRLFLFELALRPTVC